MFPRIKCEKLGYEVISETFADSASFCNRELPERTVDVE